MLTGSKSKRGWQVKVALLIMALLTVATALPTLANVARSQPTQPPQIPTAACPPDGQCFADVPSSNPFSTYINRIYQQDLVSGYDCGALGEPCDAYNRPYYRPVASVTRSQMAKFIDNGRRLAEINIEVPSGPSPIYAKNNTG